MIDFSFNFILKHFKKKKNKGVYILDLATGLPSSIDITNFNKMMQDLIDEGYVIKDKDLRFTLTSLGKKYVEDAIMEGVFNDEEK